LSLYDSPCDSTDRIRHARSGDVTWQPRDARGVFRRIALESAVGGMLLSVVGMTFAALGVLSPVGGAIAQEAIDLLAMLNALRTAQSPSALTDF
jgi:hypothetical protein